VGMRSSNLIINTPLANPTLTQQDLLQDVRALIDALATRRQALDKELLEITEALEQGDTWHFVGTLGAESGSNTVDARLAASLEQLEAAVRELNAQASQEQSLLEQATVRRQLAWDALQALTRKERELAIALETTGAEVRLASPALAPTNTTLDLSKRGAIGAIIGLLTGMIAAFVADFYHSRPALHKPEHD